jgi:hypothetical protein
MLKVDSAALQTGFDGLTSANQQLAHDAGKLRTGYDLLARANSNMTMNYEMTKQQLQTDAVSMKTAYDSQQVLFQQLQASGVGTDVVDTHMLINGPICLQVDSMTLNAENGRLAENMVGLQACPLPLVLVNV